MKYIIMSLIEHSCAYLLTFFICSLMELQSVVIDIILLNELSHLVKEPQNIMY